MSSRKDIKDQLLETLPAELRPLEHYIDTVSISIADKAADRTTILVTNSEVVVQQIGFFSKSLQQQRAKVVTAFETYQQEVRKADEGAALPPLPPILVKGMFLHVNCDLDVFMWLLQYAEATAQRNGTLVPLGKTRVKPHRSSSSKRASSVEATSSSPPTSTVFPIHPAGCIPLPDLTIDMVVSLALSSRFLQMMDLCAAACEYLCSNLGEVLMSDVNCDCIPEKELIDEVIFGRGMMTTSRLLDGALYVACATRTNILDIIGGENSHGGGMLLKGPRLRSYLTDLICKNEPLPPQAATTRMVDCPNRAFLTRLLGKLLASVTGTTTSSNTGVVGGSRSVGFCRHCGLLTALDPAVIQRCPSLRGDGIGPRGEVKESHEHTDINCMGSGAALDSLFKHYLIPTLDTTGKKHRDAVHPIIITEGPTTYSVSTLGGHTLPSRSIAETVEKCRRALHARSSSGPTEKECSGLSQPNHSSSCDSLFRLSPALFPLQTFFREGELAVVIILLQLKLVRPSQSSVKLCAATETGTDREPQELGIPTRRVTLSSTRYAASIMALRHHPLLTTFEDPDGTDNVGCLLEAKLLLPRKLEKYLPNCFSCTISTAATSPSAPSTPTSGGTPLESPSTNLFKSMATAGPDAVAISSYVQASRGPFSQMIASRQQKIVAKAERRRHRAANNMIDDGGSSSSDDMPDYDYEAAGKSPDGPHYETARALVLRNQEKAAYSPAYMLLDLCNMRDNRVFRDQPDCGQLGGSINIPPPTYTVRKAPVGYQRPQSNGVGARPKTSPLVPGEQQPTTPRLGQSVKKTTPSSFRQPRPPGTKR